MFVTVEDIPKNYVVFYNREKTGGMMYSLLSSVKIYEWKEDLSEN
jgi:hypothetical protein